MGYIDASALTGFMPKRFEITASSVPDLAIAQVWCDLIGAELNAAALKGGWEVPVATGATVAYGIMALYNQYGAGWHVLEQRLGYGGTDGQSDRAVEYRKAYQAALKGLELGTIQLPGAAQADSSERVLPLSNSGRSGCSCGCSPCVGGDMCAGLTYYKRGRGCSPVITRRSEF